jgi:hypothetical protein
MATVIQAVEAYNNTMASIDSRGKLIVRTLKSIDKIVAAAEPFGYKYYYSETVIEDGIKELTITLAKEPPCLL